jgi:hypothetical protein
MTDINTRALLSNSLDDRIFEQQIFVTVNSMFGNEARVPLGVTIPGETEEAHGRLRRELCGYLSRALTGIDDDWVASVAIEKNDSCEDEVVVIVDNPEMMDVDTENLVLSAVRVFMTLQAKRMYRQLTVLGARQMAVPLNFDYGDNILKSSVQLQLPMGLQLMSSGRKVNRGTQSYTYACSLIEETLRAMLLAKGISWRSLDLRTSHDGVKLEVLFDGANPPRYYELNDFEATVVAVLGAYCRFSDTVFSELVFQPVRQHKRDIDDGSELSEYDCGEY